MKNFLIATFFFFTLMIQSQVTEDLLMGIHAVTTAEMNALSPVAGALVYNTEDTSLYSFNGTTWENQKIGPTSTLVNNNDGTYTYTDELGSVLNFSAISSLNYGARYTNTNTITNLNITGEREVPLFGTVDYNDGIYSNSATKLTVSETGRYEINANIVIRSTIQRANLIVRIAVNGINVGAIGATGYMRNISNHSTASLHLNEILNLNSNDVITITSTREANAGNVFLYTAGSSSFNINKIK